MHAADRDYDDQPGGGVDGHYERSLHGLNDVGRDQAMATATSNKWAAAEDARDRAIDAESDYVDSILSRCPICGGDTGRLCDKHKRQFNLPD